MKTIEIVLPENVPDYEVSLIKEILSKLVGGEQYEGKVLSTTYCLTDLQDQLPNYQPLTISNVVNITKDNTPIV